MFVAIAYALIIADGIRRMSVVETSMAGTYAVAVIALLMMPENQCLA